MLAHQQDVGRLGGGKRERAQVLGFEVVQVGLAGTARHHAEGPAPTAERTVNPAGASRESLTASPELENSLDPNRTLMTVDCNPICSHMIIAL